MKKNKRLAVKLTIPIALVSAVIFAVLITATAITANNNLQKRELDKLDLLARENAGIARDQMEALLDKLEAVAAAATSLPDLSQDKQPFMEALLNTVRSKDAHFLSLFYIAEPDSFLPDTPEGFSIFATNRGILTQKERFSYIDKSSYESALKNGRQTITDPQHKIIDGKNYKAITLLLPVHDSRGNVTGIVGSHIDTGLLSAAPFYNGGYETFHNVIISGHKILMMDSDGYENIGRPFMEVSDSLNPGAILGAAEHGRCITLVDTQKDGSRSYAAFAPFFPGETQVPWLSGVSIHQQEIKAQIVTQTVAIIVMYAAGLILLILFSFIAIHRMLKPITQLDAAFRQLAQGKLDNPVSYHGNDELGKLAHSYRRASGTISGYIRDIHRAMSEMAKGNFDLCPEKPFMGDFSHIETSITVFIQKMCETLRQIRETAEVVTCGSRQLADSSVILSQGACEQAASIQELNAAISMLSNHVQSNENQAREAVRRVEEAGNQLDDSSKRMGEMTRAMDVILSNSNEIQQIIKTIEDIAFQTNLLALNAAVEAARAGEAGKGFSVVAGEVRSLAAQSALAANNTTELLQKSLLSINEGAGLARNAAVSLDMVQEKAAFVIEIVEEISAFSQKQKEEIQMISQTSAQISGVVQSNSATAEECAATAEELLAQAERMRSITADFRLKGTQTFPNQ